MEKIFLQKYCFSFDLDNGKIRFYQENNIKRRNNSKVDNKNDNKNNSNIRYYQLGLIFVILTIAVIAFIWDRVVKRKSNRLNNSLIDYNLHI